MRMPERRTSWVSSSRSMSAATMTAFASSLRRYAVRVEHEVVQQLERGGGGVDADGRAAALVGVVVELEVARHDDGVLLVLEAAGAAEDGADAGDDLFEAEGLGHIVIAADG